MIELVDQELALLLGLLALGDVDQAPDDPAEPSGCVALGDGAMPDPDPMAVAMADAVLRFILRGLALEQRPTRLVVGRPVLGVDALVPGPRRAGEAPGRFADDVEVALGPGDLVRHRIVIRHAAVESLGSEAEALLTLPQGFLGSLMLVDIDRRTRPGIVEPLPVAHLRHEQPVPAMAALAVLEPKVELEVTVLRGGALAHGVESRAVLGMHDLIARCAVAPEALAVEVGDAPIAVDQRAVRLVDPQQAGDCVGEGRPAFHDRAAETGSRGLFDLQLDRPPERGEPAHQLVDGDPVRAAVQHLRERRLVGAADSGGLDLGEPTPLQGLGERGDELRLLRREGVGRRVPFGGSKHRPRHRLRPPMAAPSRLWDARHRGQ
jgi:hypothetical protein